MISFTGRANHPRTAVALLITALVLLSLPTISVADYITVKGSYLNVRSGPGTTYEILKTITEGESFPLAGIEGLWCRIVLEDGREAWVYRSYVEVKKGDMPGLARRATPPEEPPPERESFWARTVLAVMLLVMAAVAVWRRQDLKRWFGRKMQSASGYRREEPFRYDAAHPDRDDWRL